MCGETSGVEVEVLSSGSKGVVARVRLGRRGDVVVKVRRGGAAVDESWVARVVTPDILIRTVTAGDSTVLVYRGCERSLRQVVREEAPLPPRRAIYIALSVARQLLRLHGLGLVHGDLKPENIAVCGGSPAIVDLDSVTRCYEPPRLRTLEYAAPEQFTAPANLYATDVYQLALLLHELATGVQRNPLFGEELVSTGVECLDRVISAATAAEPRERPSMAELISMLEECLGLS